MKTKLLSIFTIILGLCIFMFSLTACNRGNNNVPQGPNNTIQQGRNLIGEKMQGNDSNSGSKMGILGRNRDSGFGTTPGPDKGTKLGTTPGTSQLNQYLPQQLVQNRQKADTIRNELYNSMREIGLTNVVVNGNNALIGYKLNNTIKDANATKNRVVNKVKQFDNSITNVLITNTDDGINKLNQLTTDMTNNRPVQEINTKFQEVLQGLKNTIR